MAKKFLSILLVLVLVLGLLPAAGAAALSTSPTFSDMPDNWATEALESAVANGLLVGDDGKIMPDSPLTRAQMATIIARAFGATKEGDISEYADVKSTDWFAGSMAKAYKMGVMQDYAGKMEPNSNISREQAFVVLARALKLEPASVLSKSFEDEGEISDWAKGEVYALVNAGYIQGSNGKLNPKANISRAEFAQMMHNLIKQYIKAEGEYTEVANGNIMVNVPGVTLKNVTINGDLIVGDGVGDGNLTLDNVTIKGRLLARGGGVNSITIIGGSVEGKVIVAKVDGDIRVSVEGGADVEVIVIDDGKDDVIIEGTVGTVQITAAEVPVVIQNATVEKIEVVASGATNITVANGAAVTNVVVNSGAVGTTLNIEGNVNTVETSAANTAVSGTGTVSTVTAKEGADHTAVTTPNTKVNNEGASGVTAGGGKEVPENGSVINNNQGTDITTPPSGGGPSYVAISAISVEGDAVVGATLTAKVTPDKATVNYEWMRSESENEGYAPINDATDSTYELVAADVGKYIKVRATGTGDYRGTVESEPMGPVVETATFKPVDSYGIHDGKVYAGYELQDENGAQIPLVESNIESMSVKDPDGNVTDLTVVGNEDPLLWFNIAKEAGTYTYEVKTKAGKVYTATLNWDKEINTTATWEPTGKEGIRPGTGDTYVEYKLMDGENQVSLKIGDVKLIASKEGEKWVELEPNTDETLWFNKAHETGSYDFFIVTSDGTMYKVTLDWVETIAAAVDYNAVWNESRGTWYIKVTVPDENLDAGSVQSIHAITEAGVDLDEPRELTPDTDKVMWFGVAKADGEVTLKADGEYAYKVVRTDGSKYIFNFTYDPSQVQGVTNLVAAALDAVNNATSADNYAAVRTALEENANKLGLNLDVYNQLTPDGRKNAVANDIYNNKPAGGYTIETLKPMFDEIVATRMVFQNSVALFAAASETNPLTDLGYITMLIENLEAVEHQTIHSGRSIKDDILPELNKLVEDFKALNEAQQEAVLASIDYTKSSSSTATRNALRAAITKVLEDEAAAVQAALDAVNAAQITDRVEAYNKLMEVAETLGLNVGEGSDFAGLVQGRAEAAAKDLFDNKPAGGYDLETLQATFNEIVATRLVFEQSVALFAAASAENPLEDLSYITMLIENLENVEYQTIHSGKNIEGEILPELEGLVADFNALTPEQQETVLKDMNYSATTSSTATRNALRAAITQVLADEEAAVEGELETGQGTNIQMLQTPMMNSEDPVAEEPVPAEAETEVTVGEATENDEAIADGAVEEVNGEEITEEPAVETDETQLEAGVEAVEVTDEEVVEETVDAEDTIEEIQETAEKEVA